MSNLYFPNYILLRHQRDQLLASSDKYLISDYPISSDNLISIKNYRQDLRDYMNTVEDIYNNTSNLPEFPQFPL